MSLLKDLTRLQSRFIHTPPNASPVPSPHVKLTFVSNYGHGKTLDAKRSVLHPDLKTIPHQPQVQVIGNGFYEEYEG